MKPIDSATRVKLYQNAKKVLGLLGEKKFEDADKILAEMAPSVGKTCLYTGLEARRALLRGNKDLARTKIKTGMKMAAGGDVLFNRLAVGVARDLGDRDLLGAVLKVALKTTPSDAIIQYSSGGYCYRRGEMEAARTHYEAAVNLKPRYLDAMRDLAVLYWEQGKHERALRVLARGQEFKAGFRDDVLQVGNARYGVKNYPGAQKAYELLAAWQPDFSAVYSNLGSVYRHLLEFAQARQTLKRAALLQPDNDGAYYNLGNLEKENSNAAGAVAMFRWALYCAPEKAMFHWNLSLALLADGQLGEGFAEYEWRWETESFPTKKREFDKPEWDGQPLEGRTLFLIAEQGIGDALQFLRFVPDAVKHAQSGKKKGRIILEAHEEVIDLYSEYADMVELVPRTPGAEPEFDCHFAQLSLPLVLDVKTLDDLPKAPYINVIGKDRFPVPGLNDAQLNAGIVWGGNPAFAGDNIRSSSVEHYAPLFGLQGIQCYSLQKGPREADLSKAPKSLIRLSPDIKSFADTVSIVRQLDVTVTTCTSVAHLVGAMGAPVFVLLSHNADWRWLQHRDDSPWYPSARLFRQTRPGDWAGVIERVGAALTELRDQKAGR